MIKILDPGRWVALMAKNWVNPFATLFFNFYYLPFWQAVRLPIWLYGMPRLLGLKGKVVIEGIPSSGNCASKITSGMIKLNVTQHNPYHAIPFEWVNDGGTVIFKGKARFPNGGRIHVFGDGNIILGNNILVPSSEISCQTRVEIGDDSWVAGGGRIFDTDFHFFRNTVSGEIAPNSKPVVIGNNVSVFTDCFVGKGVVIPDNVIVAAKTSMIKVPEGCCPYTVIGGNPVRVLKQNVEKMQLDWRGEKALADKFKQELS